MSRTRSLASAISVIVTFTFMATCFAGLGTCASTPVHINTEPGGLVYAGTASTATNTNGALFWNLSSWTTNGLASHQYFTDLRTGERLKPNITVLEVTGEASGDSRTVDNVSLLVKDAKYTEKTAQNKKVAFSGHDYDITVIENTSGTWKLHLQSRCDGRDVNDTYFHIYLQDPLNHTLLFKEGTQAMATGNSIPHVLGWDIGDGNRTFYMPNASSQYWLDVNGGSDMGGTTFKLVTGALDLTAIGKANGTTVIRSFEIKYMNSTGSFNRVVIHPQVETMSQEKGKSTPATPATTPVLLAAAVAVAALFLRRKREGASGAASERSR
jgi:hypothetical protein